MPRLAAKPFRGRPAGPRLVSRRPVPEATKKYVDRRIRTSKELRFIDTTQSAQELNFDTPLVVDLTQLAQGDGDSARDGSKVKIDSVHGKFTIDMQSVNNIVRLIVLQWKPDSAAIVPDIDDSNSAPEAILSEVTATSTGSVNSHPNWSNRGKFKILTDTRWMSNTGAAIVRNGTLFSRKMSSKVMQYNDAATTGKNHIFLLAFSNVANAGTGPVFNATFRVKYRDM